MEWKGESASGQGISEKTYAYHVGLDVHKESIAVAVAEAGRAPAAVPIATGWNDICRVGLAPTGTVHLCTAH